MCVQGKIVKWTQPVEQPDAWDTQSALDLSKLQLPIIAASHSEVSGIMSNRVFV